MMYIPKLYLLPGDPYVGEGGMKLERGTQI